ncbi:MAG: arsenite methyltransferase [Candidatus Binataceae bacterium]
MGSSETDRDREIAEIVRERYGKIARAEESQGGCCGPTPEQQSQLLGYSAKDLSAVPKGANLGVGCGTPLGHAALKPGETVIDLGSGAGFDAFLAAREVGETGRVIGVDMTPEMIERARANAVKGGYHNVEFREGRIEALPVESGSVDAVISNCVINLAPDKPAVFREVARVLRPGGRMVVSDVVLDAPLPPMVAESAAAWTGCVAGAELRPNYLAGIERAGLVDVEVLQDRSFGDLIAGIIPAELVRKAEAEGIDVAKVANRVRSLTIRARKPASACC